MPPSVRNAALYEMYKTVAAHKLQLRDNTLRESFSQCILYNKKGAKWKVFTDAVVLQIAKDMVPIYTVEKSGFIHMQKNPDVLPSWKYFEFSCTLDLGKLPEGMKLKSQGHTEKRDKQPSMLTFTPRDN